MKVISFSLWGDDPKYNRGAIRNAQLAREIYPDWVCRFYVGEDVPIETLGAIWEIYDGRFTDVPYRMEDRGAGRVIPCFAEDKDSVYTIRMFHESCDWRGMFWRFCALEPLNLVGEDSVDVFISRDCDSRLSLREKAAVDEWLESDELIHVMRDHPHHSVPILGGMWGMKKGTYPTLKEDIDAFLAHPSMKDDGNYWQVDQEFLAQYVWTKTRRIMTHDDGFWTHMWGGKPFPTPRKGCEFVGQVFDEHNETPQDHIQPLAEALLRGYGRPN